MQQVALSSSMILFTLNIEGHHFVISLSKLSHHCHSAFKIILHFVLNWGKNILPFIPSDIAGDKTAPFSRPVLPLSWWRLSVQPSQRSRRSGMFLDVVTASVQAPVSAQIGNARRGIPSDAILFLCRQHQRPEQNNS